MVDAYQDAVMSMPNTVEKNYIRVVAPRRDIRVAKSIEMSSVK
jgi:hypothetical protein